MIRPHYTLCMDTIDKRIIRCSSNWATCQISICGYSDLCMGASPKCSIKMLPSYTLILGLSGLSLRWGTTWAMALGLWDYTRSSSPCLLNRKLEIIIIPAFFGGRICGSLHLSISFFIRPPPLLQDCTGRVLLHMPSPLVSPMRSVYSSP